MYQCRVLNQDPGGIIGSLCSQAKEHEVRQEGVVNHACICGSLLELSFLLFQSALKSPAAVMVKQHNGDAGELLVYRSFVTAGKAMNL